jgi:hypothetical protein
MTAGVFAWIGKTVENMTPIDALTTPRLYTAHGTRTVANSAIDKAHKDRENEMASPFGHCPNPKCGKPIWTEQDDYCHSCRHVYSEEFKMQFPGYARGHVAVKPEPVLPTSPNSNLAPGLYRYQVVPFIGTMKSGLFSSDNAQTVSAQLQHLIDDHALKGWEFYSLEKVDIQVNPGCIGQLLGQSVSYITFDQVIFRRVT